MEPTDALQEARRLLREGKVTDPEVRVAVIALCDEAEKLRVMIRLTNEAYKELQRG